MAEMQCLTGTSISIVVTAQLRGKPPSYTVTIFGLYYGPKNGSFAVYESLVQRTRKGLQ